MGLVVARIRSIKPEFAADGALLRLSHSTALFFILLWNHCDDFGYFKIDSLELSKKLCRWRSQEVKKILRALVEAGLIKCSQGLGVGLVTSWHHQRIDKPRVSEWQNVEITWDLVDAFQEHSKTIPRKERIGEDRRGEDRIVLVPRVDKKEKKNSKKELSALASPASAPVETDFQILCRKTLESYSSHFFDRHGFEPPKNARVHANVKQFCQLIGSDAPAVMEFYVKHPDVYYVKNQHPIGLAVSQFHQLYTQWKSGRAITSGDVKAYQQQNENSSMVDRVIAKMAREEAEANSEPA